MPGLKSWRPSYHRRAKLDEVLIVVLQVVVLNEAYLIMLKVLSTQINADPYGPATLL